MSKSDTTVAIAIAGSVDSGKSSFIGVTTSDVLDDGRGLARSSVAVHKHEIDSGQTSAISTRILKTDNGKGITFIDLCGHEKYLKTTVKGIAGHFPDYACIIISPHRGILDTTRQHYKMLISQNIPIFIIITRIDVSIEQSYKILIKDLDSMCKKSGGQKIDIINNYDDYHIQKNKQIDESTFIESKQKNITKILNHMLLNSNGKQVFVPVITISNVDGYYIDVVKQVMGSLEPREIWNQTEHNNRIIKVFKNKLGDEINYEQSFTGSAFYIDSIFNPIGIGIVVSGILRGNTVNVNDKLYLGPIGKEFIEIKIKSIHNNNREDVQLLENHGRGSFAISIKDKKFSGLKKSSMPNGVMLITKNLMNHIAYRFKAAIFIFSDKSVSIRPGYTPVIHLGNINQSARVLKDSSFEDEIIDENGEKKITKKILGPGSVASMWFKFLARPEFIEKGCILTFRSGQIHGVGLVLDMLPLDQDPDSKPDEINKKSRIRNRAISKKTITKKISEFKPVSIKL